MCSLKLLRNVGFSDTIEYTPVPFVTRLLLLWRYTFTFSLIDLGYSWKYSGRMLGWYGSGAGRSMDLRKRMQILVVLENWPSAGAFASCNRAIGGPLPEIRVSLFSRRFLAQDPFIPFYKKMHWKNVVKKIWEIFKVEKKYSWCSVWLRKRWIWTALRMRINLNQAIKVLS